MMQASTNTTNSNQSTSKSSTQLSELPAALTARILGRVPMKQRLASASLVNSAWRDAAAQATVHIECSLTSATAKLFETWLAQHASQVQTLKVTKRGVAGTCIVVLPWARLSKLQSLNLTSMFLPDGSFSSNSNGSSDGSTAANAPAGSDGSSAGGSAGSEANIAPLLLPALRELELTGCTLESADVYVQLASNSLQLTSLVVDCSSTSARQALSEVLSALLKSLPQLVVLRLPKHVTLTPAAARHVAAMHSLRELQLGQWEEETALPSSLTSLEIAGSFQNVSRLPTQLPDLTQLLHLHLKVCALPFTALASMPQLQHLQLYCCKRLPLEAPFYLDAADTAALLASLLKLTRLQHLQLDDTRLCTHIGSPQEWSALTASTQLTYLSVQEEEHPPLLKGAAQQMWPAGRRLPHLQTLLLNSWGMQDDWCLTSADLASIVSACPGLQELGVVGVVRENADLSPLLQLPTGCSSLHIGGEAFTDDAVAVIKQLPQLRSLEWSVSESLTDVGLFSLTELTALTSLEVSLCFALSAGIWEAAGGHEDHQEFTLQGSDTKGPVWQQLLAASDHSGVCAAATRKRMEAEIEDLRQQLAASQAQVLQLQGRLADAEAGQSIAGC